MSLFDAQDVMEIRNDLYPADRLVLCRNPLQAEKGKRRREELPVKTEEALDKIVEATKREQYRLKCKAKIGIRVGQVIGKYKVRKFFTPEIEEEHFAYERYKVVNFKCLSTVELAIPTMKQISLQVRPIHHRKKNRGIAHVFICTLACYVEYHLRRKLPPMLSAEDNPAAKATQRKNAVEPAKSSP